MIGEELRNLEGADTQDINSDEVSGAFTRPEVRDKLAKPSAVLFKWVAREAKSK